MPTTKQRINLSVDNTFYETLERLRKYRKATSISALVLELAQKGLELEEDLYFAQVADKRENQDEISHDEVWS